MTVQTYTLTEMKRILTTVLLLLLLSGCSSGVKIEANEHSFLIGFRNNCDCEIYKVHHEYYIGDEPIGGGYACNADGSAIRSGDVMLKDFIPADFPEGANLAEFRTEVFVVDGVGKEYPCGESLNLDAAYGKEFEFTLTGNYDSGFGATWSEK